MHAAARGHGPVCVVVRVRRPRRGVRCGARPGVVPHNSLRSLRSLRSDRMRQVRSRSARVRAPTPCLCSSPPHTHAGACRPMALRSTEVASVLNSNAWTSVVDCPASILLAPQLAQVQCQPRTHASGPPPTPPVSRITCRARSRPWPQPTKQKGLHGVQARFSFNNHFGAQKRTRTSTELPAST